MQSTSFEGARLAALEQVVHLREAAASDGYLQDTYDQTVTYLLSSHRSAASAEYLLHDAIRDARKSCARLRRRHQDFLSRAAATLATPGAVVACCTGVSSIDPEDHCVASDLEARIRSRVAALGEFATFCLEAMLAGLSVAATARSSGRPVRTVERMRATIRSTTTSLLEDGLAA